MASAGSGVPENITGGCLCGKVRYTLKFPSAESWPPQSATCQCTQCRKQTGALIAPLMNVESKNLTWSALDGSQTSKFPSELREFESSTHGRRSFCNGCGSAISWRSEECPHEIEILLGSVDEKWLIGDRTEKAKSEDLAKEGAWDALLREEGDMGRELCEPKYSSFFRNAVKGVTDRRLGGGKDYLETSERGFHIPD